MDAFAPLSRDTLLRHEAFVLRLARSLVRDEASAEDVAQETLLAALEHQPQPGVLRSWLARVTRHRALDHLRGERRRSEREAQAARSDRAEPGPTPQEQLELEHRVVSAVLALEEPYRGVVIAAYYEGLAPTEIARRRRVAAGTVRSQLSRALDQLRAELDRRSGGDRSAWSLALVGLLRARDLIAPAGTAAASSLPLATWPLVLAGSAAAIAAVAVGWTVLRPEGPASPVGATASAAPADGTQAGHALASPREVVPRRGVTVVPPGAEDGSRAQQPEADVRAGELQGLLVRTRQVRAAILQRRLEVDPRIRQRYSWLEQMPDSGVVKLLDRGRTGTDLDLPWMSGGGAYFSFTERVHDYQRRPQIGTQEGKLLCGFYGGFDGAVLDLGEGAFRQLALDPRTIPAGLGQAQTVAWDVLWRSEAGEQTGDRAPYRAAMRAAGLDDDADIALGHTYLLRAYSREEFDVVVALEVADVGEGDCTLAWRLLDGRPVENERPVRGVAVPSDGIQPLPAELELASEQELLAELADLRSRAELLLLESIPAELEQRFAGLVAREDAGLTRIVERTSPWTELPRPREGGAYYSFATRSHSYDDEPDLSLEQGRLRAGGFAGADTGMILDLGELSFEQASRSWAQLNGGPVFDLAIGLEIDHGKPRDEVLAALRDVQGRVRDLRAGFVTAQEGHSYLLRTIEEGAHDLLTLVEVVELDEAGALIAWQILRAWPVPHGG